MAGWQEAATTPDLQDWLQDLDEQDWDDLAEVSEVTVEHRKVVHRDSRTPLQHFEHLHQSGMPMQQAKAATERWMARGGDATEYSVRTADAQKRPDAIDDRPGFVGFYRGGPARLPVDPLIKAYRDLETPKTTTAAEELGRMWFEMRHHG